MSHEYVSNRRVCHLFSPCSREPSADFSTFISEGSVPFPPARVSLLFLYILSGQGQLHAYQDFESEPGLYADFKAKLRFVCP
jgi:hypothetical protein